MLVELLQTDLEELIRAGAWDELRDALAALDVADVAALLADLPPHDAGVLFRVMPARRSAEAFSHLPAEEQEALVASLAGEQVRALVTGMTPDDQTRLLEELPPAVTRRLLEVVPPDELAKARDLLGYPPDSAGRFMTPEYATVSVHMSAREALDHLRRTGRRAETLSVVYVVDADGRLLSDLRLSSLVLARPDVRVADLIDRPLVSVPPTMDREEVLGAFRRYDRVALPVVGAGGHLLGILTVDDVLDVAAAEATEDIQKLGGSGALGAPYLRVSIPTMVRKRGGWLSVLFVGQLFTATVMERYEAALIEVVALAVFIPLIISSGGNSGSQATSLLIRALAVGDVRMGQWLHVLRRELAGGVLLGLGLGVLGVGRVWLWQQVGWADYGPEAMRIAWAVGGALLGVVVWGSAVGSMLPFILQRLGLDPATSSAPFVATLVDVTGLVIYFAVASAVIGGSLTASG